MLKGYDKYVCQMQWHLSGRNTWVASDIQGGLILTGCEVLGEQWRQKEKNVRGMGRTASLQAPGLHCTILQCPARSIHVWELTNHF